MTPDTPIQLGVRTAKATLDRIGYHAQQLLPEQARRAQVALELSRDALSVLSMMERRKGTVAAQLADKLARAAAEFAKSLR